MRRIHEIGLLSLFGIAFLAVAASGQSEPPPISFDKELERLDVSQPDDVEPSSEDIPEWKQGSWGADVQRWAQQNTRMAEQKEKAEIAAIKQKCDGIWNPTASGRSSPLVLTSNPTDARGLAFNICQRKSSYSFDMNACIYRETEKIERKRALEARQNARRNARIKREAAETASYCKAVKGDVMAGRLPRSAQANFSAVEQAEFEKISAQIDASLEDRIAANEAQFAEYQKAQRETEARQMELEDRAALAKSAMQMKKAEQERLCQLEIAQDRYSCSCSEFFPPGVKTCTK